MKERKGDGDGRGKEKNPDMPDLRCDGGNFDRDLLLRHDAETDSIAREWNACQYPVVRRRQ